MVKGDSVLKKKKTLLIAVLLLVAVAALSASKEPRGYARMSAGVNITTPVRFSTYIDKDYISVAEGVVMAPKLDAAVLFALPYGHFVGFETGLNIFPTEDARYIDAFTLLATYGVLFHPNVYEIPLEAGLGLAIYSNQKSVSTGLALSVRSGINYCISDNFFFGINVSTLQLMEFGKYLNNVMVTYQFIVEPKILAGVRW